MPESKSSPGGRRKDSKYKQLNANLRPELIKKLKVDAVELDISISELLERILEDWYLRRERGIKKADLPTGL